MFFWGFVWVIILGLMMFYVVCRVDGSGVLIGFCSGLMVSDLLKKTRK